MERTIKSLIGARMEAIDGEAGKVKDVYFDDESWTVRYLVLRTEDWLSGRKVLIVPEALKKDGFKSGIFRADITQDRIRQSPGIDTDKPVSRKQEIELYGHYAWNGYWDSGYYAGGLGALVDTLHEKGREHTANLHLRSSMLFPASTSTGRTERQVISSTSL